MRAMTCARKIMVLQRTACIKWPPYLPTIELYWTSHGAQPTSTSPSTPPFARGFPRDYFVWARACVDPLLEPAEPTSDREGSTTRWRSFPFRPRCPPSRAKPAAAAAEAARTPPRAGARRTARRGQSFLFNTSRPLQNLDAHVTFRPEARAIGRRAPRKRADGQAVAAEVALT